MYNAMLRSEMPESERKIHSGHKCLPVTDKKCDTLAKNRRRFNQVANICCEILREANPCVLAQNVKGARTQRRERERGQNFNEIIGHA
jgi:hypothetical protein